MYRVCYPLQPYIMLLAYTPIHHNLTQLAFNLMITSFQVLNVGGVWALLGLIAMARDVEGLYAAVKALVCTVRSNPEAQRQMERKHGYQVPTPLL
jgi:hypothetical protein